MDTYPLTNENAKGSPIVADIFGHRFMGDQTLMEYMIEFLLIFTAEKDELNGDGKFQFHDPEPANNHPYSYRVEPRMGLRRFIFIDPKKKSDIAQVDLDAFQALIDALKNKIEDQDDAEKQKVLDALQDLFHGYRVIIRSRSWCAQAILPVCPELIFCEAMPKKAERRAMDYNNLREENPIPIDSKFDFDKRNFLARGGELYYLHILQGLKNFPQKKRKLEFLLTELLQNEMRSMSQIASFIQKTWEEVMDYEKPPVKNLNLGHIPENVYKECGRDSVDELINFLSASMHPVKKMELLSKGIMLQVMRMMTVAVGKSLGQEPFPWIIDMKGETENIIKKIAAASFRKSQELFEIAINNKAEKIGGQNSLTISKKAQTSTKDVFKYKGKELNCIIPVSGSYERMTLSEDCIQFLVLAMIKPGRKMTLDMFLDKLYKKYGIVIGQREFKKTNPSPSDMNLASAFTANEQAFQDFLNKTGFLHELSDATSVVINTYESIELTGEEA